MGHNRRRVAVAVGDDEWRSHIRVGVTLNLAQIERLLSLCRRAPVTLTSDVAIIAELEKRKRGLMAIDLEGR